MLKQYKIERLEEEIKQKDKIINVYADQLKASNNVALTSTYNVNGLIQLNIKAMEFINDHFKDSPRLQLFNEEFADVLSPFMEYRNDVIKRIRDIRVEQLMNN